MSFFDSQRPRAHLNLDCKSPAETIKCTSRISAVCLVAKPEGGLMLGGLTQIYAGTPLRVCGDGYNEQTVKVQMDDAFFYVFREDLQGTMKKK